jgi:hypothetical protein
MASFDASPPTEQSLSLDRLKALVDAQLWNEVEHVYVVPNLAYLTGGAGMVVYDADGRVIGASPDLLVGGMKLDMGTQSWQQSHPVELPKQKPPPAALTEREQFELERDLDEWRRQFTNPEMRHRAKEALRLRLYRAAGRDKSRGIPDPDSKKGAPRKYTEHGALLKYSVKKEEPVDEPPPV